jgi:hypothetical protein
VSTGFLVRLIVFVAFALMAIAIAVPLIRMVQGLR